MIVSIQLCVQYETFVSEQHFTRTAGEGNLESLPFLPHHRHGHEPILSHPNHENRPSTKDFHIRASPKHGGQGVFE